MSGVGGESVHLRRSSTSATTTGSSKSSLNIGKSVIPTGNKAVSPMSSPNSLQSGATPTIAQLQSLLKQQQQPNHSLSTAPTSVPQNRSILGGEIDDLKSQLQQSNINDTFNEDEEIEEVTDEVIINHDYHSSDDEYEDEEDEEYLENKSNNFSVNNNNNNNNNNTSISSAHSCESIAEEEELTASPILSRQYSYTVGHGTKPDVVISISGGFHSSPRSNRSESTVVHEDDPSNQSDKVINAKDKISSDYKRMMEDPEAFRNEKLKQRKSKFFTKKDLEEIPFNPTSGTQLRSTLFQQFMNEKIQMISENPEKYKSELMKYYKQNLKPQVPKSPQSNGSLSNHSDKLKTSSSSSLQRTRSVSQPPVVTSNTKNAIGSLDTILEKERKRDGKQDRQLPILFTKCIDFLSNDDALKTEGLFRVAGNSSEVEDLMKSILLYGSDIPSNCCYHVVSNMLKKFLRQLSTPVFTFKHHNDFIQTMKLNNDEERIKAIKEILKLIPTVNQLLIKDLMRFLVKVTSFSNVNMMHAHNLGLMFGPNMLKAPSDSEMNAISMLDAGNQVITLLIENYNLFYDN
ncbi:hypothetical protein ACTA71_007177 [Dictyostelium dimigraforme]